MLNKLNVQKKYSLASSRFETNWINQVLSPQVVLIIFLALVFVFGGSARKDVPQLIFLRPFSIIVAIYGACLLRLSDVRRYKWLLIAAFGIVLIHAVNLLSIPIEHISVLPGRRIIQSSMGLIAKSGDFGQISISRDGTLNSFYSLFTPIAALFLCIRLSHDEHHKVLGAIIAMIMVSAIIGFLQSTGIHIRFYRITSDLAGLFANRNHQAVALSTLPLLVAIATQNTKNYFNYHNSAIFLTAITFIVIVILILVNGSRMGLICALISCLLIYIFDLIQWPNAKSKRSKKSKLAIVLAFLVSGSVFVLYVLNSTRSEAISRLLDSKNDARFPVWQTSLEVTQRFWPIGSGPGTYVEAYQIYEPIASLSASYSNHVHNDWLEVILTSGLLGLILLLYATALFVNSAWQAWRAPVAEGGMRRLGLLIIMILAIASVVDYPLRTPSLASLFAVAAVWAAGKRGRSAGNERDNSSGKKANDELAYHRP